LADSALTAVSVPLDSNNNKQQQQQVAFGGFSQEQQQQSFGGFGTQTFSQFG